LWNINGGKICISAPRAISTNIAKSVRKKIDLEASLRGSIKQIRLKRPSDKQITINAAEICARVGAAGYAWKGCPVNTSNSTFRAICKPGIERRRK
jgi:hypothetical protein